MSTVRSVRPIFPRKRGLKMSTPDQSGTRVAILQSVIPEYRREFFKKLISAGRLNGIHIDVFTGDPPKRSQSRADVSKEDFSRKLRTSSFSLFDRTLRLKSTRTVRDGKYQLVILEQTLQNLDTFFLLLRLGRRRIAFWGHGATFNKAIPGWQQKLKYWLTRKGTWFFGYTLEGVDAVVSHGFPRARCTVLRNSIDTVELRNQLARVEETSLRNFNRQYDLRGRTALYIGGLDSYKRIPLLLKLAEEAHGLDPDFRMLIAGDGEERPQVEEASRRYDWLSYLGRLVGEEKAVALKATQVIASPGAIGLVALDSLVSGTPIVAIPAVAHGPEFQYLDPGRTMLLASEAEYASELVSLLANSSLIAEMSSCCRAKSKNFGLDHMVSQVLEGIQGAISR